ncbi:hypothetical protein OQZ33_22900 [Pedobacter sp. MC2016-05]|uniref:hypothetical protein n=1 Tax=Pedobacter sp. MC2016-05 TaxID=2994474 RepID=UPI002247489B|nr:hypothetical protein [Pedobacter sp. MC2016-05]MCX2477201.1 hypothetical protein [Pedobacter sp. MC2016-05]
MDYQLDPIYALYQTAEKLNGDVTKQGQHILEELEGECSRVLTLMLHSKMADDATRSMIRRHQYSLTILENSIHKSLAKPSTATQPKAQQISAVLKEFTIQIVELGASIRKYFPTHFDTTHPAGLTELEINADQLNKKLNETEFNMRQNPDKGLLDLLKLTLSYSHLSKSNATHFQLGYLHALTDQLLERSKKNEEYDEQDYITLLISNEFNCPAFFHYCCIAIIRERDKFENIALSYQELLWRKKSIQQIQPYTYQPFHPSLPGIKSSLLDFIRAEMGYMKNLQKIAGELNAQGTLQDNFKTSLSVKELAFFIHLQVECGIILENRPKKVHEYAVGHYSTRETEKISEKSFKNAYYTNSREEIAKVTAKLAEMLARAEQKS